MKKYLLFILALAITSYYCYGQVLVSTSNDIAYLKVSLVTNKTAYKQGETIRVTIEVVNTSTEVITSTFNSSQKYDLTVKDNKGKLIWKWSQGKFFLMAIEPFRIAPKQKMTYAIIWGQKEGITHQVKPGSYSLVGELKINPRIETQMKKIVIIKKQTLKTDK